LITSVTLSSFNELEKKYKNNDRIRHQFLPYDSKILINNFFKNWKPDIISFVDSEIWPNFFLKIKKENIPFILLNARITKKSFKRWSLVKNFTSKLFNSISISISSNRETVNYLNYFGAQNVKYYGNIKFCSKYREPKKLEISQFDKVLDKKLWCAVSIHPGEEIFCGKVHKILRKQNKKIITIIIPRHIDKIKKIYSNLKKMGLKIQIKNENDSLDSSADIILVNYYGSVLKYLGRIKQIFFGKSLLKRLEKVGGQNPIDAAKLGCFIFHGPFVYNFKEIYDYLDANNFSESISEDDHTGPEKIAKKLINSFNNNVEMNSGKIDELNNYSDRIFNNTIKEYSKFVK